RKGEVAVLALFNGPVEEAAKWAAETKAEFPVLVQQRLAISKRYEVFATPFAFLIDEEGVVRSKGIVSSGQHVGYVLAGLGGAAKDELVDVAENGTAGGKANGSGSVHSSKEASHV